MSNYRIMTKQQPQLFARTIIIIRFVIFLTSWIQVPFSTLSFTSINTKKFHRLSSNTLLEQREFQQSSSSSATATALGVATTTTTIIEEEPSHSPSYSSSTTSFFTSPKFRIYIEDTDAYGVMYNSNYLRSYERALSHVPRQNNLQQPPDRNRRTVLTSITNQKFRSSPALGEEYIIRGELIRVQQKSASNVTRSGNHEDEENDDGNDGLEEEIWKLEMVSMSKTRNDTSIDTSSSSSSSSSTDNNNENDWTVIHNSATVTLIRSDAAYSSSTACSSTSTMFEKTVIITNSTTEIITMQLSNNNDNERKQHKRNNSDNNSGVKMLEYRFIPYHDELEVYNNNIIIMNTNNNNNNNNNNNGYYYNAYHHIIPLRTAM
ncbi:MAG: hypothetical protein ACI8RD_001015, partial [Bacillariaceae sp.]